MNDSEFIEKCYLRGMENPYLNGGAAMADGEVIVEEDRLNRNSFTVFNTIEELKAAFDQTYWCLGQAFIYGDLCFINQINGGDEWLTMKRFDDEVVCFESISWVPSIERDDFEEQFSRLEKATKQQCESHTY